MQTFTFSKIFGKKMGRFERKLLCDKHGYNGKIIVAIMYHNSEMIAFESETHGIVHDHFLEGIGESDEQCLEKLEVDGRIEATSAYIHGKTLKFTTRNGEEGEIRFKAAAKGWGGNTYNTAVAYHTIQNALGVANDPAAQMQYYTHIVNDQLREVYREQFGRGATIESNKPKPVSRQGFYIPKRDNPSDGTYISQTPHYPYEEMPIARYGADYFFSSLHPESTLVQRLEARAQSANDMKIYVAPGKQQLREGFPPEFLERIYLQAMNAKEAQKLLGIQASKKLNGVELVKELSRKLSELGPQNILLTNGGLPIAHYDREKDIHTVIEPPRPEEIRRLASDLHGQEIPEQDVSRIGCGDALLGAFMALEQIRSQRGKRISLEQSLQLSVTISRYHAWSKNPNIAYMDEQFLKRLGEKIMPGLS